MKVTNLFGEFSGRMNGVVWSRNRGGAYIRSYVTPLNPRTEKQLRQRYYFGKNSQRFSLLTDEQKSLWNTYADTVFTPLVGTGKGTGINAFVSLNTTLEMYTYKMNETSVTPNFAKEPLDPVVAPPGSPAGGVLYLQGNPIYATLHNIQLTGSNLQIDVKLSESVTLSGKSLKAGSDGVALLAVYRSSWTKGEYKSNEFNFLVACTPKLQNITSPFDTIRMIVSFDENVSGNRARFTLVLADEYGQQTPIDAKEFVVP